MNATGYCFACGQKLASNHHCSPEFEKRVAATNRRSEQDYLNRKPSEAMRINYGFHLLSLKGDSTDALSKRA